MIRQESSQTSRDQSPNSMAGIGTHDEVFRLVRKHLSVPSRITDLAAGEGAFSVRLKEIGHDVLAIDFNREDWKAPDVPLILENLDSEFSERVVSATGKFDAVVAIEIIEHLENPFRFVRECAKLLKPSGLLFLTTPNVESVHSRLIFLYKGRLNSFGDYETVRPAHITPIFKWKLEMILNEAGFATIYEGFNRYVYATSDNLKGKVAAALGRFLNPFLKGSKGGEGRIVVAKLLK